MNKYDYKLPSKIAKAVCVVCGQEIFNKFEDSTIELCREHAAEWESREHTCERCMKKQVRQVTEDLTSFVKPELDAALEVSRYLIRLYKEANRILHLANLQGRIVIYQDQEWFISDIHLENGYTNVAIYLWGINKVAPWRITEKREYYLYSLQGRISQRASDNLVITNDTLDARKARYRAWQEAEGITG